MQNAYNRFILHYQSKTTITVTLNEKTTADLTIRIITSGLCR
jgi:hypothetical protein